MTNIQPATGSLTQLPQDIIDILCKDIKQTHTELAPASVGQNESNSSIRQSNIAALDEQYWGVGFIMHYINLQNQYNYNYDLSGGIAGNKLQYSEYGVGHHYDWHTDSVPTQTMIRKLSFSLQLSDEDEYEGGELQIITEQRQMIQIPKNKGLLVTFKSDLLHRVRPVKSGLRKSIVGWITGPAWK
jgi:PKHD-type hydroxylase